MFDDIEQLLSRRWHGARTIKGIRFQILYSVYAALEILADSPDNSVQLEGLEDIDTKSVSIITTDEYIQIKTSDARWNWNALKDVLKHFLPIHANKPEAVFRIVVNNDLDGDVRRLARYSELSDAERSKVDAKIFAICQPFGLSKSKSKVFAERISVQVLKDDSLNDCLSRAVAKYFQLRSDSASYYINVLTSQFLDWATMRLTITERTLKSLHFNIEEMRTKEAHYVAILDGLIKKVAWQPDGRNADYYNAKGTRVGHIVNKCDIVRNEWLQQMDAIVKSKKACIILAASGQGKSSLLFRYAHDCCFRDEVFVLNAARTAEQASQVVEYLAARKRCGLPMTLLIDDANSDRAAWSRIVAACAGLDIPTVISIRTENWVRISKEVLPDHEIVEPVLTLDEARRIHAALLSEHLVDDPNVEVEAIYDSLGPTPLLIEFIYGVTNNTSLKNLLRTQIQALAADPEATIKVNVLRLCATAHLFDVPVSIQSLMKRYGDSVNWLFLLQSLDNEYFRLDAGKVVPLHYIRSQHISATMHESVYDLTGTVLEVLDLIPDTEIPKYISQAIRLDGINHSQFLIYLAARAKNCTSSVVAEMTECVFAAGEEDLLRKNIACFDEGFDLLGHSGVMLIAADILPIVPYDTLDRSIAISGDRGNTFVKLKEIVSKIDASHRGISSCIAFLNLIEEAVSEVLDEYSESSADLLNWYAICGTPLSGYHQKSPDLYQHLLDETIHIAIRARYAEALFLYDRIGYLDWYRENEVEYLLTVKDALKLKSLSVQEEIVRFSFVVEDSAESPFEQFSARLKRIRELLPQCVRYDSKGEYSDSHIPTVTLLDTDKHIPAENEPLEWEVSKNAIWIGLVMSRYMPKGYYQYLKWILELRTALLEYYTIILHYCRGLRRGKSLEEELSPEFRRKTSEINKAFNQLPEISGKQMSLMPRNLPAPMLVCLSSDSSLNKWSEAMFGLKTNMFGVEGDRTQYVLEFVKQAEANLPKMQAEIDGMLADAPKYFSFADISRKETLLYGELFPLLKRAYSTP